MLLSFLLPLLSSYLCTVKLDFGVHFCICAYLEANLPTRVMTNVVYMFNSPNKIIKMRRNKKTEFRAAKGGANSNDQKMQIFYDEQTLSFEPDPFCLSLWDMTMPKWIDLSLRQELVDALRGFDSGMALEIADNLIDCWSGFGLHVTGIGHVDELLGKLYMKVLACARRKGVTLAYWK